MLGATTSLIDVVKEPADIVKEPADVEGPTDAAKESVDAGGKPTAQFGSLKAVLEAIRTNYKVHLQLLLKIPLLLTCL